MKKATIGTPVHFRFLIAAVLLPAIAFSQHTLSGNVASESSGEKISGAVVSVDNSFATAVTDPNGNFMLTNFKNDHVKIHVTHLSYESYEAEFTLSEEPVTIRLKQRIILADEITILATRAGDKSAIAYTTVAKNELEKQNLGQDLPYLLSLTPSVVVTSDAGTGVGYTGIRIRGSDATRVNTTINGIPLNGPEDHIVYWVDLPDFASSVDNIQIQRGIGTSTNGAGAFGGSVNIQSSKLSAEPFASVNSSSGSFNTYKNTVQFGTGLLQNKFAFEGRLSKITSNGYIDRASSNLKSFYLSGGYYGSKSSLRLIIFSGKEKTYQAWYGVPEEKLNGSKDDLLTHYYNNLGYLYITPADSINLFNSKNRTYNYYTYDNQTDNYQQDYYQLHYSHAAGEHLNLNLALHYTKGKGYYEEFKPQEKFYKYGLKDVAIGNDTITTTDLIRQKWLDNDFYGITFSGNYEKNNFQLTAGGAYNTFDGDHYGTIVWSAYANNSSINHQYYFDNAFKHDFTVFGKLIYEINAKTSLICDLQYRTVIYSFVGIGNDLNALRQHIGLSFFNPKAGITYAINTSNKLYASIASGHKEPVRDDYTGYTPGNRPKPEEMIDAEAGYKFIRNKIWTGMNLYYMNYKNQLILTGKINDVGEYQRQNADKSYRRGVELELGYAPSSKIKISGNITFSQNKIETYYAYADDYDNGGQHADTIRHGNIAFSPEITSAGTIAYSPVKNLSLDFIARYVSKQYLDNTSNEKRILKAYLVNDIRLNYILKISHLKEFRITFCVNNIFNKLYESNGYTYSYQSGGKLITQNYYYPQAGINWLGGISLKF